MAPPRADSCHPAPPRSSAAPILRLDLSPEAQQAIGTSRQPLEARRTLAEGLRIELTGLRATMVRLRAVLLRSGAVDVRRDPDRPTAPPGRSPTWTSAPFAVHAGSTSLPGPDFVPLPAARSEGDGATSFARGDRFLRAERPICADQFVESLRRIESTGVVFGDTRVDLGRQTVLYLAVAPVAADEVASTLVVPVAFILNRRKP